MGGPRLPHVQYVPDVRVILVGEAVKYCFKAFRVNHKCCTGDLMKNAMHTPPLAKTEH